MRTRFVLTFIGAVALVVGALLDWTRGSLTGDRLTMRSLVRNDFGTTDDMLWTVGAISVLIAIVAVLGLFDLTGWLTRLAGLAAVALFAMFAVAEFRHYGRQFGPAYDALGPGAWCQLGGGVVLLIAGMVRYRRKHARKGGVAPVAATSAEEEREREQEHERLTEAETVVESR